MTHRKEINLDLLMNLAVMKFGVILQQILLYLISLPISVSNSYP